LVAGLLALALVVSFGVTVQADNSPRQYYGGWAKNTKANYHYRTYYYKPAPNYVGYKHHYVIYFPNKPDHYYFYNPYKKVYWGRCPVKTEGKAAYSHLADADQKATLDEIPEKAFPAPGPMPRVPEATDDATLELPPDDLPAVEGAGIPK
jgi:hypothetical protein